MKVMYSSRTKTVQFLGLCVLVTAVGAGVLKADLMYQYADDFAADQAELDSCRHSVFWLKEASPLPEPYLCYVEANRNRGLAFFDCKGKPAELGYRFPPVSAAVPRVVTGVLVVDVSFPSIQISQSPPGWLRYSLSSDGMSWSAPEELGAGRHEIPLGSANGVCHVLFSGTRAVIDNLSVALQSAAITIRVPQNFPTIQTAINAARNGDAIEVAPGVYSGQGNRDIDFQGKAITLCGAVGSQGTIIDCGGSAGASDGGHRGFYFHRSEGADSVLSGFTVRGGRVFGFENPPDPAHWNSSPSHPIGGGIYCEFSNPTIVDCVIQDCGTQIGGGIGGVGTEALITDCVIEDCVAGGYDSLQSGGRGGAIGLIGGSSATITNCVIQNNQGYSSGSYGAGLYFRTSCAVVAGCTISGNAPSNAALGGLRGGGAYCSGTGTDVTFRNCIFSDNRADVGAGLYLEWLPDTSVPPAQRLPRCRVEVVNCTIVGNVRSGPVKSPPPAAGIQSASVEILITSSILWANTKPTLTITDAGSFMPVTYCDVEGGYSGTGNINQDPLFAAMGSGDYHLKSKYSRYDPQWDRWISDGVHSPCVDTGDPQASVGDEPVPNGGRINMGAYGGTWQASNGAGHLIYHVDCSSGREGNDGLSRAQAFANVQDAIDAAQDGDTIVVWPGVYPDRFSFMGKSITVQSAADAAVLTAADYAVSFYYGEGPRSVLANFVITGCGEAAIFCKGASPSLKNLTLVGNTAGVYADEGADPNITNCILWDNAKEDLFQCTARYSDIQHKVPEKKLGNIRADPLFADPQNGDYHLKSEWGRYVPRLDTWVTDDKTSPCIDAGDIKEDPRGERMPNGGRINMGAYGGTPFASLSG